MSDDHTRLDDALNRSTPSAPLVDLEAFGEFRAGILRHISMEEKVLLPAAQAAQGKPLILAGKLRLDHGAIASLLVPFPTLSIVSALRTILSAHNPLEEGPGGVYEQCERLSGDDVARVVNNLKAVLPVALAPYSENPMAVVFARKVLDRAGYEFLKLE
jgi:hypothetical protein